MTAKTLRRAASLMRERVEGATEGPWKTYTERDGPVFDQYGTGVQSDTTSDVICYSGQVYSRDAEHIASWHPAVALAVADLLDDGASYMEWVAKNHPDAEDDKGLLFLAVARAYLGDHQ